MKNITQSKIIAVGVLTTILGGLQLIQPNMLSSKANGLLMLAIGIITAVLRYYTSQGVTFSQTNTVVPTVDVSQLG